jgi:hypothetical protein
MNRDIYILVAFFGALVIALSFVSAGNCSDSDGGINADTYGQLSKDDQISKDFCEIYRDVWNDFGGPQLTCSSSENCYVKEKYCENDEFAKTDIECPYGCSDGACLSQTQSCSDSDGGKDYNRKGTVTLGGLSKTDHCYSSTEANEYFCDSLGNIDNERHECEFGCDGTEGACFSEPQTGCVESWVCSNWRECINGKQKRNCVENNNCGTVNSEPVSSRSCEIAEEGSQEPSVDSSEEGEEPVNIFVRFVKWLKSLFS